MASFNGFIGSSNGTYITMLKRSSYTSNIDKGFKLNIPVRTYHVTVDHPRRILGSTTEHSGKWDEILILFDDLIYKINDGKLHQDFEFKLYEKDKDGEIIEVIYQYVWL